VIRFLAAFAVVIAIGISIGVAWGRDAVWLYAFIAAITVCTVLATGIGGNLIRDLSRRRFER
jgi:hypothetical protein